MVKLGRILRDYRETGAINGLLALWGFVDETTFLTKAGHVGVVYRLQGIDYEGLTHGQRQVLVHRFEAGLRLLDEHCRLYQYLIKRHVDPFTAPNCPQPVANEAIQRRCAYLNDRRRVYQRACPGDVPRHNRPDQHTSPERGMRARSFNGYRCQLTFCAP